MNVDLEMLQQIKNLIEEKHEKINDILEYAKVLGNYVTIPPIRKVAMEYISRSENLLVMDNLTIERQIESALVYINSFNNIPSEIIKSTNLNKTPEGINVVFILNRMVISTSYSRVKEALEKLKDALKAESQENPQAI